MKSDNVAVKGNFSRPILFCIVLTFALLYLEVFLFSVYDKSAWFPMLLFIVLLVVNVLASVALAMILFIFWDSVLLPGLNKLKAVRLKKRVMQ